MQSLVRPWHRVSDAEELSLNQGAEQVPDKEGAFQQAWHGVAGQGEVDVGEDVGQLDLFAGNQDRAATELAGGAEGFAVRRAEPGAGQEEDGVLPARQGAQLPAEQLAPLIVAGQERRQSGIIGQGDGWQCRSLESLAMKKNLADQPGNGTERAAADQEQASALMKGGDQMFGQSLKDRFLGEKKRIQQSRLLFDGATDLVLSHACLVVSEKWIWHILGSRVAAVKVCRFS